MPYGLILLVLGTKWTFILAMNFDVRDGFSGQLITNIETVLCFQIRKFAQCASAAVCPSYAIVQQDDDLFIATRKVPSLQTVSVVILYETRQ